MQTERYQVRLVSLLFQQINGRAETKLSSNRLTVRFVLNDIKAAGCVRIYTSPVVHWAPRRWLAKDAGAWLNRPVAVGIIYSVHLTASHLLLYFVAVVCAVEIVTDFPFLSCVRILSRDIDTGILSVTLWNGCTYRQTRYGRDIILVDCDTRVQGLFASRYFRSSERKFPLRTFAPGSECSRELSLLGTKVLWNFRSRDSQFAFFFWQIQSTNDNYLNTKKTENDPRMLQEGVYSRAALTQ